MADCKSCKARSFCAKSVEFATASCVKNLMTYIDTMDKYNEELLSYITKSNEKMRGENNG